MFQDKYIICIRNGENVVANINLRLVKRLAENQTDDYTQTSNEEFLNMFLTAKHLEGCSEKTLHCYRRNIGKMLIIVNVPVAKITTERLRKYLVEYQQKNDCGKVTIDNVRRSLSAFFSWLEEEDYIIKSPMTRIHKVKTAKVVKETIPDEKVEVLRNNCKTLRDLNLKNANDMFYGCMATTKSNQIIKSVLFPEKHLAHAAKFLIAE